MKFYPLAVHVQIARLARRARSAVTALAVVLACTAQSARLQAATTYQDAVIALNPVLYWSFDEAGDTDNARSLVNDEPANELIARGAATRAPSTTTIGGVSLGRAAQFDHNIDTQSRFNSLNLARTDELTTYAIELWFNVDSTAQRYLSETFSETGTANRPGLIYNYNANELELFSGGRSGTVVTPNAWHHVVAAFYGTGNGVQIYVDGVSAPITGPGFDQVFAFGEFSIGNTARNPQALNGLIDEYAVYDLGGFADVAGRQNHVADIAQHYALVPEPGTASLLAAAFALAIAGRRRRPRAA